VIPAIILSGDIGSLQSMRLDASYIVLQKPVGPERLKEASERLLKMDMREISLVVPELRQTAPETSG
jgi:hypothetical protein